MTGLFISQGSRIKHTRCLFVLLFSSYWMAGAAEPRHYSITQQDSSVEIRAGMLARSIGLGNRGVSTERMVIGEKDCLAGACREFSLTVTHAQPNRKPQGLKAESTQPVETTSHFAPTANSLSVGEAGQAGVQWVEPIRIEAHSWAELFERPKLSISSERGGRQQVAIEARAKRKSRIGGLRIKLCYEIYKGFPVIRKWAEISNQGKTWHKLERMMIDEVALAPNYCRPIPLTPSERGAGSSVVAWETADQKNGLIAVSEVPSALRSCSSTGAMGYADEFFEWVVGPGETFVSEPVFFFGYAGDVEKTISATSTPLDRAVEGPYMEFLRKHIGIAGETRPICSPQWCSWSNFGPDINDAIIREQAKIAAACGFRMVLLDQGWQDDLVGTEPDPKKFADFGETCRYLHSLGLNIGLWVSSYRGVNSVDMRKWATARSVPLITRDGGFGMSFASPWRKFCAEDLARTSRKYGISYYKQDFTNIKFGDIAKGHESRTRKESLLRGLRGLLEAQDSLRKAAPEVTPEITHEIYWGTPGVPCDIAALKHVASYHIPPNDYAGAGKRMRVTDTWTVTPERMREQLVAGCFRARERFYAHRGLPLYALEYYAAHAVSVRGSLTPAGQDRQICSWLMGAPSVFAGDLASLSGAHIAHYRKRFDLIARLERDYGIFRNFQFSGVPGPTDTDWHWWGKLDADGAGAVVVLRGKEGEEERAVNIPWVKANGRYEVVAALSEKKLGQFTGEQLQAGALRLRLPRLGQEVLEIRK